MGGGVRLFSNLPVNRELKQLNNWGKTYQDGRVYSTDGLSIALNARGNNGWYTDESEL